VTTPTLTAQLPRHWRPWLNTLEAATARMLLSHGAQLESALAAALAVRAELAGHTFVDLRDYSDQLAGLPEANAEPLHWPSLTTWIAGLDACSFVGQGTVGLDYQPAADKSHLAHGRALVREGSRVYLRRLWRAETSVAAMVLAHVAGNAANTHALTMVTGGPGTGKTTAAARMVLARATAWRVQSGRALRVALCAPTGKAAARLTEAFQAQLQQLLSAPPDSAEALELPALLELSAQTTHRLLGAYAGGFRMGSQAPLALDLVVVDEASMLSLQLMRALFEALSPNTQLLLLGDAQQLSAVESGAPFAEFLAHAKLAGSPLFGRAQVLTRQWRALDTLALATQSLRAEGDIDADAHQSTATACAALAPFVRCAPLALPYENALLELIHELIDAGHWDALLFAPDLPSAWAARNQTRVLCALHAGPAGQIELNRQIDLRLRQRIAARGRHAAIAQAHLGQHYAGRLMLAQHNDYRLGIMNGDVGLCWPDANGELRLWFEVRAAEDAGTAAVLPASPQEYILPASPREAPPRLTAFDIELANVSPAFAMTVHKAQGSEFDHVTLVLPEKDQQANAAHAPVLHKTLIYTAITRAKSALVIFADPIVLASAIGRSARRNSGLYARLG
jgi:exodeoxyribonuclease V alpha subunit